VIRDDDDNDDMTTMIIFLKRLGAAKELLA
jgi:hypothetical protein